jgi:WD40 repeat protein
MLRRSLAVAVIVLVAVGAGPISAQLNSQALWAELLRPDAERPYQAMRQLAAMPAESLRYLREAVPPAKQTATAKQIDDLIRQLDAEPFEEREDAHRELERLDWQAAPALREAFKSSRTLEHKRRLELLLNRFDAPPMGPSLRWHRAVELVEWIGTNEARALLDAWSQGATASPLTEQANQALKRCGGQNQAALPATWPAVDAQGDPLPAGAVLRLGSTRWRMGHAIGYHADGILFTSDATRLIVDSAGTVSILDATSGKVLARRAHAGVLKGMQLSPDQRRLYVSTVIHGNNMHTPLLQLWDAAELKEIASWAAEGSIAGFSDDGKHAVLVTEKGIRRVDAATGREVAFMPFAKGTEGPMRAFNGKLAVVSSPRAELSVIDVAAPEKVRKLAIPDRDPRCVALSADGQYLAVGGDGDYGVILVDLVRGEPIRVIAPKETTHDFVTGLTFAPDSRTLAFCSGRDKSRLVLWDLDTHRPRWKVAGHVGQLAFSRDGKLIAGNGGWRTCLWEAATGKEISTSADSSAYHELAFCTDGQIMVTDHNDAVRFLDFPSGKELQRFSHPQVYRAALSPDGRRLATSAFNHELRIWDAQTGHELMKLPDDGWLTGHARQLMFTKDSRRLYTWEADFRLRVWDVSTGRLLAEHRPRPEGFPKEDTDGAVARRRRDELMHLAHAWCFSADGTQFLWHFNKLRAYDPLTGKALQTYDHEFGKGYFNLQTSRDGEWLLIGASNGVPTIFNLRRGRRLGQLPLAAGRRSGAQALAPDGRSVGVVSSQDTQYRLTLFESATLQPRLTIPLEYHRADGLSFSPNGRFLAATLSDRTALIWDLAALGK